MYSVNTKVLKYLFTLSHFQHRQRLDLSPPLAKLNIIYQCLYMQLGPSLHITSPLFFFYFTAVWHHMVKAEKKQPQKNESARQQKV